MYFDDYWNALAHVKEHCPRAETRLGNAAQCLNMTLRQAPYHLPRRARMRRELGYMELCQLLTGAFDLEEIGRVAPRVNQAVFGESAVYGPRVLTKIGVGDEELLVIDQVADAIEELRRFPGSRRAVVSVHTSTDMINSHPCISSFQFQVQGPQLVTTVVYRSCDLWFGFPHDLVPIVGLTQVVAWCLGKKIAPLTVHMANAHVYEKNFEDAGGPPLRWWFQLPNLVDLEGFRRWASDCRADQGWTKGHPPLVEELFPKVPELRPYVPRDLAVGTVQ
jgi:hypothetical protein